MRDNGETTIVEVDVVHETEKAMRVTFPNKEARGRHWIPKSQCEVYEKNYRQYASIPNFIWEKIAGSEE